MKDRRPGEIHTTKQTNCIVYSFDGQPSVIIAIYHCPVPTRSKRCKRPQADGGDEATLPRKTWITALRWIKRDLRLKGMKEIIQLS